MGSLSTSTVVFTSPTLTFLTTTISATTAPFNRNLSLSDDAAANAIPNRHSLSRNSSSSFFADSNIGNATDNLTSMIAVEGQGRGIKWSMLVLTMVILCTAVGNLLVCLAVCWERRLQNMTNYFLMSLAIADFLVSLLVMPLGMVVEMFGFFPLSAGVCAFWVTSDVLMCTASIWHMCTMSMDRFFTLKYPMRYGRNKTRRMVAGKILFVWIISMAISSPVCIHGFLDSSNVFNEGLCVPVIKDFRIYGSIFAFYIPLLIMLVTYILTIRILWNNQKRMRNIERSDLRPRLAQLTAQCTGFAIPKLLGSMKKPSGKQRAKEVQSARTYSPSERKLRSPSYSECCVQSCDDTSPSFTQEPEMIQVGNNASMNISGSPSPGKMNYLALPPAHNPCRSPSLQTSVYQCQSSESDESESDGNWSSYVTSSQSFRSLCAPLTAHSQDTWLNSSFRRKRRRRRRSQHNPKQTQDNNSTGSRIRKALHPKSLNIHKHENHKINVPEGHRVTSSASDLIKVKDSPKTCRGKVTETLVKSLSCLSTPLNLGKKSDQFLLSPQSHSDITRFTSTSSSMPKLATSKFYNSSKLKGRTPLPELKIHHASDCTTPVADVEDRTFYTSDEIMHPVSQHQDGRGANCQNQRARSSHESKRSGDGLQRENTVPCVQRKEEKAQNHQRYFRRISPNRLSTGLTLIGAVSDSHVSQAGLKPKDEVGHSNLGSFALSCGNLSKDYKSMEWDRRYFEIQEEMDQCLMGVFESISAQTGDTDGANQKKAEDYTRPTAICHSVNSSPVGDSSEQTSDMYSFYSQSMPSSPERLNILSMDITGNKMCCSNQGVSLNRGIDNQGVSLNRGIDYQGVSLNRGIDNQGVSLNRGIDNQGVSLNRGIDYQGVSLNRGIDNQGVSLNRGIDNQGVSLNRGIDYQWVSLNRGIDNQGVSLNRGIDNQGVSLNRGIDYQGVSLNRGIDNQGVSLNRGIDNQGVSLNRGIDYQRVSLNRGIDNQGVSLNRGIDNQGVSLNRGIDYQGVSLNRGIDNQGVSLNRGIDNQGVSLNRGIDNQGVSLNRGIDNQGVDIEYLSSSDDTSHLKYNFICEDKKNFDIINTLEYNVISEDNSDMTSPCKYDVSETNSQVASPLNYCDNKLSGVTEFSNVNVFDFSELCLRDKERDKDSSNLLLPSDNFEDKMAYSNSERKDSDVIKICLIPPVVDEHYSSQETFQLVIPRSIRCDNLHANHQALDLQMPKFADTNISPCIATSNLAVRSPTAENRNLNYESILKDGLISNTSSSLMDPNLVSETDLTLDETDDTLDGDQECLDDSPDTTSSKERPSGLLFRKPAFRLRRSKSNKKQKSFKKSSGKRKSFHNTFRLKRISSTSHNGHANYNTTTSVVANKHIMSKKTASNEKKASKVLGIIFLVFVLLWTPFFLYNILTATCPSCTGTMSEEAISVFVWMGYVASLANPIIYTMFNTAFRRTFINILTCRMERSRQGFPRRTPCPSYTTMVPSDRRNTVTLLLRDESK